MEEEMAFFGRYRLRLFNLLTFMLAFNPCYEMIIEYFKNLE